MSDSEEVIPEKKGRGRPAEKVYKNLIIKIFNVSVLWKNL